VLERAIVALSRVGSPRALIPSFHSEKLSEESRDDRAWKIFRAPEENFPLSKIARPYEVGEGGGGLDMLCTVAIVTNGHIPQGGETRRHGLIHACQHAASCVARQR
jgi:hypothetical protein